MSDDYSYRDHSAAVNDAGLFLGWAATHAEKFALNGQEDHRELAHIYAEIGGALAVLATHLPRHIEEFDLAVAADAYHPPLVYRPDVYTESGIISYHAAVKLLRDEAGSDDLHSG